MKKFLAIVLALVIVLGLCACGGGEEATDEAKTYAELKEQVSMGLLQPERLLGWYHNLACETPEERAQIREKYMPEHTVTNA